MNEFQLYNRIINGDLRPNLDCFDKELGLETLKQDFFSVKLRLNQDGKVSFSGLNEDFHGIQPGDKIELEIDDDTGELKNLTKKPNAEEELINLDIPPSVDDKSDIFMRIVECEFSRITISMKKIFDNSNNETKLRLYALKNIQIAKRLGREFEPIIKERIQDGNELEDELFDGQYSKMMFRINQMTKVLNQDYINRLYNEIGNDKSLEIQILFFRKKLDEQNKQVEKRRATSYGVTNHELDTKYLLEIELAKLLEKFHHYRIIEDSQKLDLIDRCEFILNEITKLKIDYNSLDTILLSKTQFFKNIQIELNTIKELINIKSRVPEKNDILKDLISFGLILQTRKHLNLHEDQLNDYLTDLLRAKNYYVTDQTRMGRSGSRNPKNYSSGELDFAIRDLKHNGVVKTIIEAFGLTSCGTKNTIIKNHINKLLIRYDTSGNKENYLIIYSKPKNFQGHWEKYKNHVESIVFHDEYKFIDTENELCDKSDLKVGYHFLKREGAKIKLYHIYINMNI